MDISTDALLLPIHGSKPHPLPKPRRKVVVLVLLWVRGLYWKLFYYRHLWYPQNHSGPLHPVNLPYLVEQKVKQYTQRTKPRSRHTSGHSKKTTQHSLRSTVTSRTSCSRYSKLSTVKCQVPVSLNYGHFCVHFVYYSWLKKEFGWQNSSRSCSSFNNYKINSDSGNMPHPLHHIMHTHAVQYW